MAGVIIFFAGFVVGTILVTGFWFYKFVWSEYNSI